MNTLTAHRNECVHDTRISKLDSVKGLSVFHIIFIAVAGEAQFLLLGIEQLSCLDRPTWLNLGCVPDLSNRANSERGSCMHKLDAKSCRRLRTHAHAHPSGPFLATVCSKSPLLTVTLFSNAGAKVVYGGCSSCLHCTYSLEVCTPPLHCKDTKRELPPYLHPQARPSPQLCRTQSGPNETSFNCLGKAAQTEPTRTCFTLRHAARPT